MKLSKKNQARQRAIRKALAGGKSVSGLLAGALALATTGCSPKPSPGPIGRFPDRNYEERARRNANNEKPRRVPMGDVPSDQPIQPKAPGTQSPNPKPVTPPLVRTTGEVPPPPQKPPQKPNR